MKLVSIERVKSVVKHPGADMLSMCTVLGYQVITAKTIQTTYRIFAGLYIWKNPTDAETEIRCEKLIQGTVAFGKLVITMPKIPVETIKVGNLTFDKKQVETALSNLQPIL